jgi:hypothetical protein
MTHERFASLGDVLRDLMVEQEGFELSALSAILFNELPRLEAPASSARRNGEAVFPAHNRRDILRGPDSPELREDPNIENSCRLLSPLSKSICTLVEAS